MPQIQWRDAYGYEWSITSSEPDTIAAWLLEQAKRTASLNTQTWEQRVIIYPMMVAGGVTDWPVGQQDFTVQADGLVRLAHLMAQFAQREEVHTMAGAEWCDFANHPFKAGAEGTIRSQRKGKGNDTPQEFVVCPECAASIGLNPDYEAPDDTPMQRRALLAAEAKVRK